MYTQNFQAGPAQHRAILNTYYSLAACVLATFSMSAMLSGHKKFVMVIVEVYLRT
jgi:ammonium transporter Rh